MTLHLLKLQPDMMRLNRWTRDHGLLPVRGDDDLGYALHALLAANFGELAPKPFVLRRDEAVQSPALLAYSAHGADALREHAASFAEPDAAAAIGLDTLAAKAMPERFPTARLLGFTVRVRPTVRTDKDGDRDAVREVDAFLAAVDGTAPNSGPERGAVYRDWLAQRLQPGAELESLELDSFRLTDVLRRNKSRSLQPRRGPDAAFSGVLRVAEPDAFAALLARGVGRHRAFGYGMLLLRPAPGIL